MTKWMRYGAMALALLGAMGTTFAEQLVARVNGVAITVQDLDELNRFAYETYGLKLKTGVAVDQLIARELLAQEGIRRGKNQSLDKGELAQEVFSDYAKEHAFDENDVRREYEQRKAKAPKKTEYKIRAIVVKKEQDALTIIDGLNAGKPLSLYIAQSIDENSKKDGGDMGWLDLDELDPPFAGAVLSLKPGMYQKTPVRSSFGFAVVQLDDIREDSFPAYVDVRESLIATMRKERQETIMKSLSEKANIERFPGYESSKRIALP